MHRSIGFKNKIAGIDLTIKPITSPIEFDEIYIKRLFCEKFLRNSHFFF